MSRWVAPSVAVLACAGVVLILAAPFIWVPAAGVLYVAGSFVCHQIPERSFHLDGTQLPVCARCVGLYGGGAFGSVIAAISLCRRGLAGISQRFARLVPWQWTAIAAMPTAVTFVLEWGLGWPISNGMRAIAALSLGFAVAFVVVSAAATVDYE